MNYPRIKTMTIDAHDGSPVIIYRFVSIGATNYHLVRDVGHLFGFEADTDGDYRSTMLSLDVPFEDIEVDDRGQITGPVAAVTEEGYRDLVANASMALHQRTSASLPTPRL